MRYDLTIAILSWLPADWPGVAALQGAALTQVGKFAEAERLLSRMTLRWPQDGHVAMNHAFVAEARGDMVACLERWLTIRDRHSDQAFAHAGLGTTLRKLGRLDQARDVLRAAQARFPENVQIATEAGWLSQECGDFHSAVTHWHSFVARFPDRFEGPLGAGTALRSLLQFDEADAVLADAVARFPGVTVLASNYAVNADARGDRKEALLRWREVVRRHPDQPIGYAGCGAALKALGQFDAADQMLGAAMQRFPGDANLGINHAWVADARADWAAAAQRWQALLARFPEHRVVRTGVSESVMKARLSALDRGEDCIVEPAEAPDDRHRNLLMQFEPLGENCELGFVQRHFRAEPLSLLRWAGISCERLIAALDTDLDGVGDPENTIMRLNPHNHEYYTEDSRYGMSMHTFILEDPPERDVIFDKICRRLGFLRRKLCSDMQDARKIFVYQCAEALNESLLRALHAALRRYGPVTLLHVHVADGQHAPGHVVCLEPGLLLGFLDRTGYDGKRWDIAFNHWLTICQNAVALRAQSVADLSGGESRLNG